MFARNAIDKMETLQGDPYSGVNVCLSTAAELAATVEDQQFQVASGDELVRNRHSAGGTDAAVPAP